MFIQKRRHLVKNVLKGLALAVVISICIGAVTLFVYAFSGESTPLLGVGVAGFVFLIVLLNEFMKTKQRPGEQVSF